VKRIAIVIGFLLVIFALAMNSGEAATVWHTYRTDVTTTSGSTDIDAQINLSYYTGTGANVSGSVYMPVDIENLTYMNFTVANPGAVVLYHNLTINSVLTNNTGSLAASATNITNKYNYTVAGGDDQTYWLNWTYNCSGTTYLNVTLFASDATLISTWIVGNTTIKEKDVYDIEVGETLASSYWTVNNSIALTNNIGYNLSDVRLNITYPSHKVTNGSANWTFTTLANGSTNTGYTQYQKYAPYVYSVDEDLDGNEHTVTIRLKSSEVLTNCVDWTVITSHDVYEDYFDTLDESTLVVKLNGAEIEDWESGSIILEDFTVRTSPASNKWDFIWTVSAAPSAAAESIPDQIFDLISDNTYGIPNILIIGVIIAIILIGIVAISYSKPAKSSRKTKSKKKK